MSRFYNDGKKPPPPPPPGKKAKADDVILELEDVGGVEIIDVPGVKTHEDLNPSLKSIFVNATTPMDPQEILQEKIARAVRNNDNSEFKAAIKTAQMLDPFLGQQIADGALHAACKGPNGSNSPPRAEMVAIALDMGADARHTDPAAGSFSVLCHLADKSNTDKYSPAQKTELKEAMRMVIKADAPLNHRNDWSCTAFMMAATQGNDIAAEGLHKAGADTRAKGRLGIFENRDAADIAKRGMFLNEDGTTAKGCSTFPGLAEKIQSGFPAQPAVTVQRIQTVGDEKKPAFKSFAPPKP